MAACGPVYRYRNYWLELAGILSLETSQRLFYELSHDLVELDETYWKTGATLYRCIRCGMHLAFELAHRIP